MGEYAPPVPRRSTAVLTALRPRQWPKNLLLFAGVLFAGKLSDRRAVFEALTIFAAYCAVSSAAYLLNDLHDVEQDRLHPTKRLRPVASGALPPRAALALAACLGFAGLGVAAALGLRSLAFLGAFAALQLGYTFALKRLFVLDVLTIGALFLLRAAAGAAAVHVHISRWLLLCTTLLALFLAFAKRRAELILVQDDPARGRPVLALYSVRLLTRLVAATAAAAFAAYAVYAATGHDSAEMVATVPFVAFGLGRYLFLIHRRAVGEEPEQVLLTDPATMAAVALWAATAALVLTRS